MSRHIPLFLLYGNERFLIEESRKKIIETYLGDESDPFNIGVYDLNEVPLEEGLHEAETMPLMAAKRIIILKNPLFLTAEKQKIDHDLKMLEAYIKNPSPHAVVIFEGTFEKVDARKKIVKLLKEKAKVIVASKLKDAGLFQWLEKESSRLNLSIDREGLEKLVYLTGTDLRRLQSELTKLQLYAGKEAQVTTEMIEKLVARSLEDNVFSLIEHVAERRKGEAFQILYDLLAQKEEPIKIVALLARQLRIILQVKERKRQGYTNKQIASSMKIHPYVVTIAEKQGRNFTEAECFKLIDALAETDYVMKTGKMDKRLSLEMLLSKI